MRISIQTQEDRAIKALQRLAKKWPKSLWLFSGSGTLWIMRKKNGQRAINKEGGMDSNFIVRPIDIENDGGDW